MKLLYGLALLAVGWSLKHLYRRVQSPVPPFMIIDAGEFDAAEPMDHDYLQAALAQARKRHGWVEV